MGAVQGARPLFRIATLLLVLAASSVTALADRSADAQTRKPATKKGRATSHASQPAAQATAHPTPDKVPTSSTAPVATDAGVVESRSGDGGTHVFKFSELDIEGRLKSPQLVYFLRRVRAEFAAGDLGHRPFLREMSETRQEQTF